MYIQLALSTQSTIMINFLIEQFVTTWTWLCIAGTGGGGDGVDGVGDSRGVSGDIRGGGCVVGSGIICRRENRGI